MSSNQTANGDSAKESADVSDHSKWKIVHNISSDWIGFVYRLIDCILLFCVIVYQSSSLSYYITQYNDDNNGWYFLFLVDFLLAFLFMFGSICAVRYYRKLHVHKRRSKTLKSSLEVKETNGDSQQSSRIFNLRLPQWMGSLPLVWISWLFYVIVMSSKIFIVHLQDIALQFSRKTSENPNLEAEPHTIRLCLGAMTVVFLLWIEIHRNHNSNQSMDCIKELTTSVVFEIFDSIDLLELLIPHRHNPNPTDEINLTKNLSVVILILATINLLLPTIGLYRLSRSRFDSHKLGLRMNILHNFFRIFFVNIPYMLLRIFYWVSVEREISIFLLKNALFLFVSIRHIVSEVHELRKSKQESKDETEYPLRVVANRQDIDTTIEG